MKQLLLSILTFFILITTNAQTELSLASQISKVTVFQSQAEISATSITNVNKGRSVITIEEVPLSTDGNSIRVKGTGDFMILGTKLQQSVTSSRQTKFTKDIEKLTEKILEIEMLLSVAKSEKAMIEKNSENIKSETDGLFTEEFKELIEFTRKQLIEVGKRVLLLNKEKVALIEKKKKLEREHDAAGGNQQLNEIVVTIEAQKATAVNLDLTYLVNGAGWSPTYDIRSAGIGKSVTLNYRANVYQRTGIDWKNVQLTLSTANPRSNQTKPELYPQFLNSYEPNPIMQRKMKMATALPMADAAASEATSLNEVVSVSESGLSVNFNIKIPYSIKSNGQPEIVEVQTFDLPADYKFFAVPKYAKSAFLIAEIKDWEQLNLLPGQASIYFEGAYIGKTYINGLITKDNLKVSLGAATKVVVERKELSNFKSKRVIGGNIKETFVFETSIRNTSNEEVSLVVEEQIPVSQDSQIEIDFEVPTDARLEKDTGKLTYRLTVGPNERIVNKISYEVKYPKEMQISNL